MQLFKTLCIVVLGAGHLLAAAPTEDQSTAALDPGLKIIDENTYIDANAILMFVGNTGVVGQDYAHQFGQNQGTYYPYFDIASLEADDTPATVMYGAGIWVDNKVGGNLRVAMAEYGTEYVPGPMLDGQAQPDHPDFRVYRLHEDSLAGNPSQDYLQWPVAQGAPVGPGNTPRIRGRQLTWTVFNDADPFAHDYGGGSTEPLGVEVRQTIWAGTSDSTLPVALGNPVTVTHVGSSSLYSVEARIFDTLAMTGHEYAIVFREHQYLAGVWSMVDLTTGLEVNYTELHAPASAGSADGISVEVFGPPILFESFSTIANASGPLGSPLPAALASVGFPTPGNADPGAGQQVNGSRWAIHRSEEVPRWIGDDFLAFNETAVSTTHRGLILRGDLEMRFTGSYANPGVGGSYAPYLHDRSRQMWVPFEIWRIGQDTPNDTSDDVRMIPIIDDRSADTVFGLESWGSAANGTCQADCEHLGSPGDDDPYTDYVFWALPADTTPGDAGYQLYESEALAGRYDDSLWSEMTLRSMVLIGVDAGETPPFARTCPEQGTIFRIETGYEPAPDTFYITPPMSFTRDTIIDPEASSIYMSYDITNASDSTIDSCFIALWLDPDIGEPDDDYLGSDSVAQSCVAYNSGPADANLGVTASALGFRALTPLTGTDGVDVPLYAINTYNQYDRPRNAEETYLCLNGRHGQTGDPWMYEGAVTRFPYSGNPVAGTGWLDTRGSDVRGLVSFGPFAFEPGVTKQVRFKMAAVPGFDYREANQVLQEALAFDAYAPMRAEAMVGSANPIPPLPKLPVEIVIGNLVLHPAAEIYPPSVRLNGMLAPDSTYLSTGHPAMPGEVFVMTYRAARLFELFRPTVSGQTEPFRISFETNDGQAYEAQGELSFQLIFVGDLNGDQLRNLTDLTLMVNYLFVNGEEPLQLMAGDVDCDGVLNLTDITLFVNGLFRGDTLPTHCQ